MATKRARGSSSSGASPDATTSTDLLDLAVLEDAATVLEQRDRPYAASLIRTYLAEYRAAAERAET